jgi:iron complex transport system substrate-binding protein
VRVVEIAPYTLEEVLESFRRIGGLVGRWTDAAALVAREREALASVARRAPCADAACPRVAIVLERDPLYVVGEGSFVHSLLEAAGARNVFGDLAAPYPRVSLEELVARAPDLLLDASVAEADAGEADAAADVRSFWSRFGGLRRARPLLAPAITLPAPPLAGAAELLLQSIHPGAAPPRP